MSGRRRGKSGGGGEAGRQLAFHTPVPRFPFIGQPFTTTVCLTAGGKPVPGALPLDVSLAFADDGSAVPGADMTVNNDAPLSTDAKGNAKLSVVVRTAWKTTAGRLLALVVSSSSGDVTAAMSSPLAPVSSRLVITSSLPEKWYKDEGGKDKCMEAVVQLQDASGHAITNRQLPIHPILVYEDETPVARQNNFLKLASNTAATIKNGTATVRFRVEDVSKNHQNQRFRLKICAAEKPDLRHLEVSSDLTSPVTVRSKRNKKRPAATRRPAAAPMAQPFPPQGMPMAGAAPVPYSSLPRIELGVLAPTSVAGLSSEKDSLNKVVEWSNFTVKLLQGLEWQLVGHEAGRDGSIMRECPIYRCPGCLSYADTRKERIHAPTCPLTRALSEYTNNALPNMHTLVRFVHGEEQYRKAANGTGQAPPPAATAAAGAGVARMAPPALATAPLPNPPEAPTGFAAPPPKRSKTVPQLPPPAPMVRGISWLLEDPATPSGVAAAVAATALPQPGTLAREQSFASMFDFSQEDLVAIGEYPSATGEDKVAFVSSVPIDTGGASASVLLPGFDADGKLRGAFQLLESGAGPQGAGSGHQTLCNFVGVTEMTSPQSEELEASFKKLQVEDPGKVVDVKAHENNSQMAAEAAVLKYWEVRSADDGAAV